MSDGESLLSDIEKEATRAFERLVQAISKEIYAKALQKYV